ncbi:MAG: cyanophycin synthetase, partial [Mucinivorans sp.]
DTIQEIRCQGKIITVVGCGGDRDKTKRPEMARIAAEKSDRVILTSDNPRGEDPAEILSQMNAGLDPILRRHTLTIENRAEAIRAAVALASENDIILIAGKGHENYQEIQGVRHHFDDKEQIQQAFAQ